MDILLNIFQAILVFIPAILILVLIHELGHFLTAKMFGMRVERFSIGFPPRLVGKKFGDTDYCISATPLGGYVKISGMLDESMDTEQLNKEPQPWEFRSKPVWQRSVVITAGVIFNVLLAVVIYAGMAFSYGQEVIPPENVEGIYIEENSVADEVGFETGDRIVEVNGHSVDNFMNFFGPTELTDSNLTYTVLRDGERRKISVPDNLLDRINEEGFISLVNIAPSLIGQVKKGAPADEADLQAGDRIVAVNGDPVNYWLQLTSKIENADGALSVTVERDGEQITKELTPNPDTQTIGVYLANLREYFDTKKIEYNAVEAVGQGFVKSGDTMVGIVQGLGKLLSGSISVKENLGGPVAIASVTKRVTDQHGMRGFWEITAFLSVTLAIMNILPIPVLDGGHLVFLIYEGVTRREPSMRVRMILQQIGFILLVGLIIFVTFNDILRHLGY